MLYSFIDNKPETTDWALNRIDIAHPVIDPLPVGAVGYSTNNQFNGFPPLMMDGRSVLSSWQTTQDINANAYQSNGIKTNFDYRRYMINNAKMLTEQNLAQIMTDSGHHTQLLDATASNYSYLEPHIVSNANTYNGYTQMGNNSDLKSNYLSREELAQRNRPVVMTQEEFLRLTSNR